MNENSIKLYPAAAGLPWHCTIPVLRQTKHWKAALSMVTKLLNLFAEDDIANTTLYRGSKSYANMAKKELRVIDHSWPRFTFYLWPAADERRLELLSATMTLLFIFDDLRLIYPQDVWEMQDEETIRIIQSEFISCLKLPDSETSLSERERNLTPLQAMITQVIQGYYDEDLKGGDGGKDVVKYLIDFINHPPPAKTYNTLREYVDYRIVDMAAQYGLAGVKFSLHSSVQIDSPTIKRFIRLSLEHICYSNDLGSYEKEKQAYNQGRVSYIINAVDVIKKLFNLPDDVTAKSVTLALQKQTEIEIGTELEQLRASGKATAEELEYCEAVLHLSMGNTFASVVMSRYGGDVARLIS
ncbi:Terpene cyclase aneC [Psilocybe cubensis]|uniref:Terpene cyclase aneC n=1 Tax=Psilocybe cubensis TaxID=181762 RepID=A0ACB8H9P4_PSICU|nr:Terpene cyclase aneC [Psilocybe cubensis]KAH9484643.1 Terpene cyclase aneC [Psilocybe cubensis]